jgi:hypothetical protein
VSKNLKTARRQFKKQGRINTEKCERFLVIDEAKIATSVDKCERIKVLL